MAEFFASQQGAVFVGVLIGSIGMIIGQRTNEWCGGLFVVLTSVLYIVIV